ncbi:hypothetical protein BKA70DRAFT_1423564 [Coprinopsis sp. MPI-PUGE-AT-0042]|nr:hypothetical protein BKA70DRAFT_1423564 [Coprinopsis sp. MPI-PUGE-AT-0042]
MKPLPEIAATTDEPRPGNDEGFAVVFGVSTPIPPKGDLFFKRVTDQHIVPFPPLTRDAVPNSVPLIVLCLPFTVEDQLRYTDKHNLILGGSRDTRCQAAPDHLRCWVLPRQYSRWATVDDRNRCAVIATNESTADLERAFDPDMIESIRRLMGVRWIPTWNIPDVPLQRICFESSPVLPDQQRVGWPTDLPSLPRLTWGDVWQVGENDCTRLFMMVEVRLEVYAHAKGGQVPPDEVPMCRAFQLDVNGQD